LNAGFKRGSPATSTTEQYISGIHIFFDRMFLHNSDASYNDASDFTKLRKQTCFSFDFMQPVAELFRISFHNYYTGGTILRAPVNYLLLRLSTDISFQTSLFALEHGNILLRLQVSDQRC
jgi:hypothetical protein